MTISNQLKLILFMQAKQSVLMAHKVCREGQYFNSEDATDIAGWSDEDASRVWTSISWTLASSPSAGGLGTEVCPFCLFCLLYHNFYISESCPGCPYGKRHGVCSRRDVITSYGRIISAIYNKGMYSTEILDNETYREIIDTIEREVTG